MFEDDKGNPREERRRTGYNFLRVPEVGRVEVICLTDAYSVYRGHYYRGRMVPCQREKCTVSHEDCGTQVRYVIAVLDVHAKQTSLLDMGAAVAEVWLDAEEKFGGLRGVAFSLEKEGRTKRGRITCKCVAAARFSDVDLPAPPDVREILKRVWEGWGL